MEDVAARITQPIAALLDNAGGRPIVLAVSGGVDSMVMLDAVAAARAAGYGERSLVIAATFDHRTGPHAREAVELVRREGHRRGVSVETGRSPTALAGAALAGEARVGEADWRRARWDFLRDVARRYGAMVATAHTRDDHLETVVMRILRGAGVRGLAALLAPSPVQRPLLSASRGDVLAYAHQTAVPWLEDPTNTDRRFFRNRVRHDLLPALRAARPTLPDELLALARRAADLRLALDEVARAMACEHEKPRRPAISVPAMQGAPASLRPVLWQSAAALGGITLDHRGTMRLTRFGETSRHGQRIQLSGRYEAVRRDSRIEFRAAAPPTPRPTPLATESATHFGQWRFSPATDARISGVAGGDPWVACLPVDRPLTVRVWSDGDRLSFAAGKQRRVKRFFGDLRVPAPDREGWPVVLAGEEIVWIPGIRRGVAVAVRPGGPGVCIACERVDG